MSQGNAQEDYSPWRPNRFYVEVGPVSGVNFVSKSESQKYANIYWGNRRTIPLIIPTGLNLAIVAGSNNYQAKLRLLYNGGNASYKSFSWVGVGLLGGYVFSKRNVAYEVNFGPAIQRVASDIDRGNEGFTTFGITTELKMQVRAKWVAIAPFLFSGINTKSFNFGLGLDILLGKTGYSNAQFEMISQKGR